MDWIHQVKVRKLNSVILLALDVLEPLGPLGAQVLYIVQPVSGLAGMRDMVGDLADALENPELLNQLRQQLDTDTP